jgi:hypothetical protein
VNALLVANVAFAALAAVVFWRWRAARRALPDRGAGAVDLRVIRRPRDDELVERWVGRALGRVDLVPAGGGRWAHRRGGEIPVSPPVALDGAFLVEVPAERADAVVAAVLDVLLEEGYEVRRTRGRRVVLRRGAERMTLFAQPA